MRQLAERHPWIDLSRVGIYGHSGGGFATAAAMLMRALETVTARGEILSPDLGGTATTEEVAQAVIDALAGRND